ncbi:MAG: signal peptidase I [candidate division NC10 bacterium]|nr:signal peptidase I [candidate division NC10 bacterium]
MAFLQKHRVESLDQLITFLVKEEIPERYEAYLKKAGSKPKSVFREYAEAIAIAVILALIIRTFVVQAFKIPSGSMLPTLQIGDHILVNKFLYYFRSPQRGDIIVFKFPQDEGRDFIKRVIGLPGETLEVRGKQVYINGKPVEESYAVHLDANILGNPHSPRDQFGPVKIPEGHLFVMGDNRDHSMDSRFWGFLDIRKVKGEAFLIYWSWDRERHWPRWERIGHLVR